MTNDPQQFSSIEDQINILKSRHLTFKNEKSARNCLAIYGYYNIINGYKEPYVYKDNGKEFFKPGVTFEQIFSLFILDHTIRNGIMLAMLDIEEHLRSITSYVIAELYTSKHSEYLKTNHYRDRAVTHSKFSRRQILKKLNKALNSDKDPIKYSMTTYNNVPPWILFKGIYMNTLVNFIRLQKPLAKSKILGLAYGIDVTTNPPSESIKSIFTDSLFMFLEYRNIAAHGGRIYNHIPTNDITLDNNIIKELETWTSKEYVDDLSKSYGISRFLDLLLLFDYSGPYRNLSEQVRYAINEHLTSYPQDVQYILKATGIDANELHILVNNQTPIPVSNFIKEDGSLSEEFTQLIAEVAATKETLI